MAHQSVGTRLMAKLAPNSTIEVEALKAQVRDLQASNAQMQEMLHAAQTGAVTMRGYLNKWREVTPMMGLFSQEWELRWFTLAGTVMRYYKTERDASLNPRGIVDVANCVVEISDDPAHRWAFRIVEAGGTQLLRLSTDNQSSADAWVEALRRAGLRVQMPWDKPTGRGSSMGEQGMPSRAQQERWEVSSADSELPDMPHRPPTHLRRLKRPPQHAAQHGHYLSRDSGGASDTGQSPSARSVVGDESSSGAPAAGVNEAVSRRQRAPMTGSTPVHTATRSSYLSPEGQGLWTSKHDGLFNLGSVILVATNFRLILENLLKYGLRMNLLTWAQRSLSGQGNLQLVACFPALLVFAMLSLGAEKLGSLWLKEERQFKLEQEKKGRADIKEFRREMQRQVKVHEASVVGAQVLITTVALVLPCSVISWAETELAPSFALTMLAIVVWMKLVSYAHCNYDLRNAHRQNELRTGERGAPESDPSWALLEYPENLTWRNMMYFMAVPTLTYQLNFPRSHRIRKRWLVVQFVWLAFFAGLGLFIMDQYMVPAVDNSLKPMRESDWLRILERILKLALPNLYCWLIMFYCLFHLWLNILAELTCFGDREFYKDWWNAATVGDYWKLWNMPVHKWLLRTVYFPLLRRKVGRFSAMLAVFLVSAVFHELVLGVPLGMLRGWAFAGIMLQVPLISLSERLKKRWKSDVWGNYVFWITFCVVGQPVSVLLYAYDRAWDQSHAAGVK